MKDRFSPHHRLPAHPSVSLDSWGSTAARRGQAENENPESEKVAEIVVTGSLLPTTPDQVAVPIITLECEDDGAERRDQQRAGNPAQVGPGVRGRSNAGTSNANNDNQRTGGGSQLQLRNLPTLVLINGRRAALHAIAGTNGKNFVDVNQIPAAAMTISRCSPTALHPSTAPTHRRVVNFILKSDKQGLKVGGRFGSSPGDYRERSAISAAEPRSAA